MVPDNTHNPDCHSKVCSKSILCLRYLVLSLSCVFYQVNRNDSSPRLCCAERKGRWCFFTMTLLDSVIMAHFERLPFLETGP